MTPGDARWVGAGSSRDPDADAAARSALQDALQGRADPRLLVVFASDAYDLALLLAALRDTAPDVPLIGCSTAGEIARSGAGDSGVVVMALGGQGFQHRHRRRVGDRRRASARPDAWSRRPPRGWPGARTASCSS